MDIKKVEKIIEKMKKDQLKACLLAIVENLPEAGSYVLLTEKEEDVTDLARETVGKISNIINRYSGRNGITESRFLSLCRELDRYRGVGDKLLITGKFKQAMDIYLAIADIAEDVINSTDAEGYQLGWILKDIRDILKEDHYFNNSSDETAELKSKVLSVINKYENNYGDLDFV